MSVVKMKLVSIIGFVNELDLVASACVSSSSFEPDYVDKFFKDAGKFNNYSCDNNNTALLDKIEKIANKIKKKIPVPKEKKLINKKQIYKYVSSFFQKYEKSFEKLKNFSDETKSNFIKINNLKKFESIDYRLSEFKDCKYISTKFIEIPKENFSELVSLQKKNESFTIKRVCNYGSNFCCVAFMSNDFRSDFNELISTMSINEFDFSEFNLSPKEEIVKLIEKNREINLNIDRVRDGIYKFWDHQKECFSEMYYSLKEYEKNEQIKHFVKIYRKNFILVGWVPSTEVHDLVLKLKNIARVEYSVESGNEILKFSPPTKLKNKKIFSPFEFFVSTYGLPKYSDIDPTPFVAITYTIIFGMMFADVGQGLVLSLVGILLYKLKSISLGKAISICGISSFIFGFVFGSVFGFEDVLTPLYNLIGFHPLNIMKSSMQIIGASIGVGIISIILAMFANIYSCVKKKDYVEAIFSHSGFCGICLYLVFIVSVIKSSLLEWFVPVIFLFTILIFLKEAIKNRFKVDWGEYSLSHFFELFEIILGYFTNTISFMRIGIFIFVHAGMMMVILSLAEMTGHYALIVPFGNIFVVCFEALLVGMQVMRLQFCELFGRFFEGGGREFKPVISSLKLSKSN